jgi:hypothetical protein
MLLSVSLGLVLLVDSRFRGNDRWEESRNDG